MLAAMGIKEFRRAHLERAVEICGSAEELSRRSGISPVYISAIRAGRRGIGHKIAAKIESVMGWPAGFMDKEPDDAQLDEDIVYLLKTLPEESIINALLEALPKLSKDGLGKITASLLQALAAPESPKK